MSDSVVASYDLPFLPFKPVLNRYPTMVLGENGTAFVTDGLDPDNGPQVVSFNLASGAPNWSYQASAGTTLSIIEATPGNGLTINDSSAGVIHLDSSGNLPTGARARGSRLAGLSSFLQGAVPFDLSNWLSTTTGGLASLWSPNGTNGIPTLLAQSVYPKAKGSDHDQSSPPFCQRKNVNCALVPTKDGPATSPNNYMPVREVEYRLFSLQNGTLTPLYRPGVKIEEWEAGASNGADTCSWQKPSRECESPNDSAHGGEGFDGPGQYTDDMGAGLGAPFTIYQQFLVDRQGVQVFWPNPAPTWYGAWGTPSSTPPGFQPNQTASVTTGWATIAPINVNISAPTACPSGCDTMPAQAAKP